MFANRFRWWRRSAAADAPEKPGSTSLVLICSTFLLTAGLVLSVPIGLWFSLSYLVVRTCSVLAAAFAIWRLRPRLRLLGGGLLAAAYGACMAPRYGMPIAVVLAIVLLGVALFAVIYFVERRLERKASV